MAQSSIKRRGAQARPAGPSPGAARDARLWQVVAAIPPGCVTTYGEVARLAGFPRGARLVGPALGRAPDRTKLPWHRVIAAGGRIALPAGSQARRTQLARLRSEGVVIRAGRVDLGRFGWVPASAATPEWLDALLWGPASLAGD